MKNKKARHAPTPPAAVVSTRWAEALRRLMAERPGLTQNDVADGAGVDKNTIGALLKNKPTTTITIQKLADYFGLDIAEFFVSPAQADLLRRALLAHATLLQPAAAPVGPTPDDVTHLAQKVLEQMAPMVIGLVSSTLVGERTRVVAPPPPPPVHPQAPHPYRATPRRRGPGVSREAN